MCSDVERLNSQWVATYSDLDRWDSEEDRRHRRAAVDSASLPAVQWAIIYVSGTIDQYKSFVFVQLTYLCHGFIPSGDCDCAKSFVVSQSWSATFWCVCTIV